MKILKPILMGVMAGLFAIAQPVFAKEQKQLNKQEQVEPSKKLKHLDVSLGTDFFTKNVCRGFTFSENPVLRPWAAITYKDFTLTHSRDFDIKNKECVTVTNIIDYTTSIKDISLSLGYGHFKFPNTKSKTQEIYASVGLEEVLNPGLTLVYDFDTGKGTYGEFSIGHDVDLNNLKLSTNLALGYNHHYSREDSGLSHTELKVELPITEGKVTVTPNINYSKSLDEDFQDEFFGGFKIKINF